MTMRSTTDRAFERNEAWDAAARELHARGLVPVPVVGKECHIPGWPQWCDDPRLYDFHEIDHKYGWRVLNSPGLAEGVAALAAAGAIFLDVDAAALEEPLKAELPLLRNAPSWRATTGRGPKFLLRSTDGTNRQEWGARVKDVGELIAWRALVVMPPSPHPMRGVYAYDGAMPRLSDAPVVDWKSARNIEQTMMRLGRELGAETRPETNRDQGASPDRGHGRRWDGTEGQLIHLAQALAHVDMADRDVWRDVLFALVWWADGDPQKLARLRLLWDAASRGGEFMGVRFGGARERYDEGDQEYTWGHTVRRYASEPKRFKITVGTIYFLAKQGGWRATAAPGWVAPRLHPIASHMPAGTRGTMAIAAMNAWADTISGLSQGPHRLLGVLLDYLNAELRLAWPSRLTLCGRFGIQMRTLERWLEGLYRSVLRFDPTWHNSNGTTGAWYVVPPNGWSWDDLIAWHRTQLGHEPETANAGADGLCPPQEQSRSNDPAAPDQESRGPEAALEEAAARFNAQATALQARRAAAGQPITREQALEVLSGRRFRKLSKLPRGTPRMVREAHKRMRQVLADQKQKAAQMAAGLKETIEAGSASPLERLAWRHLRMRRARSRSVTRGGIRIDRAVVHDARQQLEGLVLRLWSAMVSRMTAAEPWIVNLPDWLREALIAHRLAARRRMLAGQRYSTAVADIGAMIMELVGFDPDGAKERMDYAAVSMLRRGDGVLDHRRLSASKLSTTYRDALAFAIVGWGRGGAADGSSQARAIYRRIAEAMPTVWRVWMRADNARKRAINQRDVQRREEILARRGS
jgi:hypothetical protein